MRKVKYSQICGILISLLTLPSFSDAASCNKSVDIAGAEICSSINGSPSLKFLEKTRLNKGIHSRFVPSQSERIKFFCEMRDAVVNNYVGSDVSKQVLDLDVEKSVLKCVEEEVCHNKTTLSKFWDRARQCSAGLKDGHLNLTPVTGAPLVFGGLLLREVSISKNDLPPQRQCQAQNCSVYMIQSVISKYVEYVRDQSKLFDIQDWLSPGSVVWDIDGVTTEDAVLDLMKYMESSTDIHRKGMAVKSLFVREFAYPSKPNFSITIGNSKGEKKIRLPWFRTTTGHPSIQRALDDIYMEKADVIALDYKEDRFKERPLHYTGYSGIQPLFPVRFSLGSSLYFSDHTIEQGKTLCYFLLSDFQNEEGLLQAASATELDSTPLTVFGVIPDVLEQCISKKLPVVLDLRENSGGLIDLAVTLASFFNPSYQQLPGLASSLRTSKNAYRFLNFFETQTKGSGVYLDPTDNILSLIEAFNDSSESDTHTDFVNSDPILGSPFSIPFNQKLVVLTSEFCFSSCDLFTSLVKKHKLGTIIGKNTSGAAIGSYSHEWIQNIWKDSSSSIQIRIPHLLTINTSDSQKTTPRIPYKDAYTQGVEKIGVAPDILYSDAPDDILNEGAGWIQKIKETLF